MANLCQVRLACVSCGKTLDVTDIAVRMGEIGKSKAGDTIDFEFHRIPLMREEDKPLMDDLAAMVENDPDDFGIIVTLGYGSKINLHGKAVHEYEAVPYYMISAPFGLGGPTLTGILTIIHLTLDEPPEIEKQVTKADAGEED